MKHYFDIYIRPIISKIENNTDGDLRKCNLSLLRYVVTRTDPLIGLDIDIFFDFLFLESLQ